MSIGLLNTLLAKTLHGSLNNDISLVVLTFKGWFFYLLRNNNDVVIQRKFYNLLHCCMFVFLCPDSAVLQCTVCTHNYVVVSSFDFSS